MSSPEDYRQDSSPSSDEGNLESEDTRGSSARQKRRRNVDHVSKACDACRTRKTRCDGILPSCGACYKKGTSCTFEKTDGRKKRRGNGSMREKLDSLMNLLLAGQTMSHESLPNIQPVPVPSQSSAYPINTSALLPVIPPPSAELEQHIHTGPPAQPHDLFLEFTVVQPPETAISHGSASPSHAEPASAQSALFSNDRLKRPGTACHMQYGPTSFWSYAPDAGQKGAPPQSENIDLRPGDWVHWAKHLPPDLKITKRVHDSALNLFGAYYAPWCMAADMPAFLRDMEQCNLVTTSPASVPTVQRTSAYSPLLHNCALHLGLHFNRLEWQDLATAMDSLLPSHCASMLIDETEDPNLSTPRALALFAACMNLRSERSAHNTGYIHFGMAFACVQALGVNLKCDHLVEIGHISGQERALRTASYWTLFQQDLLRAICAGRPCMLSSQAENALPTIDPNTDAEPWLSPTPGNSAHGLKSMRSTAFHWSAKLACVLRQVVDIALSTDDDKLDRDSRVVVLLAKLDSWRYDQPFQQPNSCPLPHILVMHMMYHLTVIYLLRPYFRATLDIQPSPADRCEHAAETVTELLKVYESTHGLRNGVASIIPVIFANATIRLLVLVSCPSNTTRYNSNFTALDECTKFMSTMATTWIEARRALETIHFLRNDWLPFTPSLGIEPSTTESIVGAGGGEDDAVPDEVAEMLQDWLLRNSMFDMTNMTLPQTFDLRG